jgi:hypothetical protein
MSKHTLPKPAQDNRANQLNPAHPAYYRSRGIPQPVADLQAERAREDECAPKSGDGNRTKGCHHEGTAG